MAISIHLYMTDTCIFNNAITYYTENILETFFITWFYSLAMSLLIIMKYQRLFVWILHVYWTFAYKVYYRYSFIVIILFKYWIHSIKQK